MIATRSLRRSRQGGEKQSWLQLDIFLPQHHLSDWWAHFCTKISHVTSRLSLALFNIVCLFFIKCWQHTGWSFFFLFNIWFVCSGYIWSMLLRTLTCSQDDWSPAGWVLWCLVSNRWCLHPGEATKADRDVQTHKRMRKSLISNVVALSRLFAVKCHPADITHAQFRAEQHHRECE